jgi:hypothetical protein
MKNDLGFFCNFKFKYSTVFIFMFNHDSKGKSTPVVFKIELNTAPKVQIRML